MSRSDESPAGGLALRVCPSCGHDMTLAPGSICPECGRMVAVLAAEAEAASTESPGGRGGSSPALGTHAAKGFTFMLAQGLGTRVVTFACQMVLSYLLLPEHFGILALSEFIAMFASLVMLIGVREILVSRPKKLDLWANAGFWIMTTAGLAAAVLIAAAAPLASRIYDSPELLGIMLVNAASLPFYAMSVVAEAKLQSQLRFKYLAAVTGLWAFLLPTLTVLFAALGMGVYSFVVPRVIVGVVRAVLMHRAARLRLRWNPQFGRWRYIVGTSSLIFATSVLALVGQIGDRPLLSIFVGEHSMGLYTFAWAFSLQTIVMISINLQGVLFATLARLNDEPERQLSGYLRASRVLAAIVTPICLVQVAASEPAIRTLFNYAKWQDAIPAMQILGMGMVFLGAYCPATSMLEAQRRFKVKFWLTLGHAVVYIGLCTAGAAIGFARAGELGSVYGTAIGVAVVQAIANPVWSYAAIRHMGGRLSDALGIVTRPLIAGGLAVGAAVGAASLLAPAAEGHTLMGRGLEHWVRLAVIGTVSMVAYAPLMRLLMPAEFAELAGKFVAAMRRLSPGLASRVGRLAGV